MSKNKELPPIPKPCPFCGSEIKDHGSILPLIDGRGFFAQCLDEKCLATGPVGRNENQAITRWNERRVAIVDVRRIKRKRANIVFYDQPHEECDE